MFVSTHNENTFTIKLGLPSLKQITYGSSEVHWIPPECYTNVNLAKRSSAADVWAFATTVWQIFTYAEGFPTILADHNQAINFYMSGKRLKKPQDCPNDIYHILQECWNHDQYRRRRPQAIMRDVSQIMYEVYNSRRKHAYATISPKILDNHTVPSTSTTSLLSNVTDSTVLIDDLTSVASEFSSSEFSTSPNVLG